MQVDFKIHRNHQKHEQVLLCSKHQYLGMQAWLLLGCNEANNITNNKCFPSPVHAKSQGQEGFHQSLRQHQSSVLQKQLRREDQGKKTEILATLAGSKVQDMSHIDRSNIIMNLRRDVRTMRDRDLRHCCSLQEMHCCMCQG